MQSPQWYVRRLRTMDSAEIAWRVKEVIRTFADSAKLSLLGKFGPSVPSAPSWSGRVWNEPGFRVSTRPVGAAGDPAEGLQPEWLGPLLERAERISQHRLSFFNLDDRHLGNPVQWNRDHEHNRDTPTGFSA